MSTTGCPLLDLAAVQPAGVFPPTQTQSHRGAGRQSCPLSSCRAPLQAAGFDRISSKIQQEPSGITAAGISADAAREHHPTMAAQVLLQATQQKRIGKVRPEVGPTSYLPALPMGCRCDCTFAMATRSPLSTATLLTCIPASLSLGSESAAA